MVQNLMGDISKWNVSNVTNMESMFCSSNFNGNITNWNVSKVKNMNVMFMGSKFNQDISKWDVSNVEKMNGIFDETKLEGKSFCKKMTKTLKNNKFLHFLKFKFTELFNYTQKY